MSIERTISHHYPIQTCLFTNNQFHSRELLSLSVVNFWDWFKHELNVTFHDVINKHKNSMVIIGLEIDYVKKFEFMEATQFTATVSRIRVLQRSSIIEVQCDFIANDECFASTKIFTRAIELFGDEVLSGKSGYFSDGLLNKFLPHEIDNQPVNLLLPEKLKLVENKGKLITEKYSYEFVLKRHQCEVADQWSFIELPNFASSGREELILSLSEDIIGLRKIIGKPLKNILAKLSCPFFLFDEGRVETFAYRFEGNIVFIHKIYNVSRDNKLASIIMEFF